MIELTQEQMKYISNNIVYIGKEKLMIGHTDIIAGEGYKHNLFMNYITIEEMAHILYVPNSYIVEESQEEKVERWEKKLYNYYRNTEVEEVVLEFAKDFNININPNKFIRLR